MLTCRAHPLILKPSPSLAVSRIQYLIPLPLPLYLQKPSSHSCYALGLPWLYCWCSHGRASGELPKGLMSLRGLLSRKSRLWATSKQQSFLGSRLAGRVLCPLLWGVSYHHASSLLPIPVCSSGPDRSGLWLGADLGTSVTQLQNRAILLGLKSYSLHCKGIPTLQPMSTLPAPHWLHLRTESFLLSGVSEKT